MAPLERYERWTRDLVQRVSPLIPDGVRFDAHVHLGVDSGSGLEMTMASIERQLDVADVRGALLIPLNASDGYHETNLRLARIASEEPDRFRSLYRVDPGNASDLVARVRDGLDAGASGIKLHPVSDEVSPGDAVLDPVYELLDERGAMVLVHTGIDVARAAHEAIDAARRYPKATFVLGHLPAEALIACTEALPDAPNVTICTAWWGPYDLELAMRWAGPDRFVFGSDPPYGSVGLGLALTTLAARAAGIDGAGMRDVLGRNFLDRVLAPQVDAGGAQPVEIDRSAAAFDPLGEVPLAFRRAYQSLLTAGANQMKGGDPQSYAMLAAAALDPGCVPPELHELAEEIRSAIELAMDLRGEEASIQAYLTFTGALALTLFGPRLLV